MDCVKTTGFYFLSFGSWKNQDQVSVSLVSSVASLLALWMAAFLLSPLMVVLRCIITPGISSYKDINQIGAVPILVASR